MIMSTTFRTFLNYEEEGPQMEDFKLPSLTQPDEVLSIPEMLKRHTSGLSVSGHEGNFYDEDLGYIPDLRELDLTEIEDLRDEYKERAKKLDDEAKARQKQEAEAKALADKQDEEDKELLRSLRKNQKPGEAGKPQTSGGHQTSEQE